MSMAEDTLQNENNRTEPFNEVKLSKKSKTMIILRILLFFFTFIYLPVMTIFADRFEHFEKKYFLKFIDENFTKDILENPFYHNAVNIIIFLIGDSNSLMVYNLICYIAIHPFIALKITMITHISYYSISIIRCLYQSFRPFWLSNNTSISICMLSYSSPSSHLFIGCYYYIYVISSYITKNKQENKIKLKMKLLMFGIVLFNIVLLSFILFFNQQNYLFQLNFAITFSLVLICIFLDIEHYIHNFLIKSMKNIYKTRKYKIKLFILTLIIFVVTIIFYNFLDTDSLNSVLEKIVNNVRLSF